MPLQLSVNKHHQCLLVCVPLRAHALLCVCLCSALNFKHAYESVLFISAFACNRLDFNVNMFSCVYERDRMCVRVCACACV